MTQEELSRLQENLNKLDRFTVAFNLKSEILDLKQLAHNITDLYLLFFFRRKYKLLNLVCLNVNFLSIEGDQGVDKSLNPNEIFESFPKLKTLQLGFNVLDVFKPNLLIAIKGKKNNLKFLKLQKASKNLVRALKQEAFVWASKDYP